MCQVCKQSVAKAKAQIEAMQKEKEASIPTANATVANDHMYKSFDVQKDEKDGYKFVLKESNSFPVAAGNTLSFVGSTSDPAAVQTIYFKPEAAAEWVDVKLDPPPPSTYVPFKNSAESYDVVNGTYASPEGTYSATNDSYKAPETGTSWQKDFIKKLKKTKEHIMSVSEAAATMPPPEKTYANDTGGYSVGCSVAPAKKEPDYWEDYNGKFKSGKSKKEPLHIEVINEQGQIEQKWVSAETVVPHKSFIGYEVKAGACKTADQLPADFGKMENKKKWHNYETGDGHQNSKHVNKMLADQGLDDEWEVVVADNKTLQLDIDNKDDLAIFYKQFALLNQFVKVNKFEITPSKSGNHHIIITLDQQLTAWKRIALQACLGSDRVREILNFRGVWNGEKDPILLIEKKK